MMTESYFLSRVPVPMLAEINEYELHQTSRALFSIIFMHLAKHNDWCKKYSLHTKKAILYF